MPFLPLFGSPILRKGYVFDNSVVPRQPVLGTNVKPKQYYLLGPAPIVPALPPAPPHLKPPWQNQRRWPKKRRARGLQLKAMQLAAFAPVTIPQPTQQVRLKWHQRKWPKKRRGIGLQLKAMQLVAFTPIVIPTPTHQRRVLFAQYRWPKKRRGKGLLLKAGLLAAFAPAVVPQPTHQRHGDWFTRRKWPKKRAGKGRLLQSNVLALFAPVIVPQPVQQRRIVWSQRRWPKKRRAHGLYTLPPARGFFSAAKLSTLDALLLKLALLKSSQLDASLKSAAVTRTLMSALDTVALALGRQDRVGLDALLFSIVGTPSIRTVTVNNDDRT